MFYVLLNVYAFGSFICFGLIGFPFHMGSILRSIYADYRSLLFDKPPSQSFLGLRNALLREGTREEALRTSLWTTFCLAQFNEGRHCNYQPTKLYLIKKHFSHLYNIYNTCKLKTLLSHSGIPLTKRFELNALLTKRSC